MIKLTILIEAQRKDGMVMVSHPATKETMFANEDEEKVSDFIYEAIKKSFSDLEEKVGGRPYLNKPVHFDKDI